MTCNVHTNVNLSRVRDAVKRRLSQTVYVRRTAELRVRVYCVCKKIHTYTTTRI